MRFLYWILAILLSITTIMFVMMCLFTRKYPNEDMTQKYYLRTDYLVVLNILKNGLRNYKIVKDLSAGEIDSQRYIIERGLFKDSVQISVIRHNNIELNKKGIKSSISLYGKNSFNLISTMGYFERKKLISSFEEDFLSQIDTSFKKNN